MNTSGRPATIRLQEIRRQRVVTELAQVERRRIISLDQLQRVEELRAELQQLEQKAA